jgi:hypothetical protein
MQRPKATDTLLQEIGPDIWTLEAPSFIWFRPPIQPKIPYPHRSVVVRLDDRSLMVISPIGLSAEVQRTIDGLGVVRHIVSPNAIHHLHMGEWKDAYSNARMYASPGLRARRSDLQFDADLSSDPEEAWLDQIDHCVFGGKGFLPEVVFHHRKSKTVVFTDLIMDFDPKILTPLTRITSRINQMYMHTPRGMQLVNNTGRPDSRTALRTIRSWSAAHLVVAHSPWLCVDGEDEVVATLDVAFDWLLERSAFAESVGHATRSALARLVWPLHGLVTYLFDDLLPRVSKRRT